MAQKQNRGDIAEFKSEIQTADAEWQRFLFAVDNGHADYVDEARRNYRYYRGNGGQWSDDDRAYMESVQGRKCLEQNDILPAVSTAVGEQIATRADISFAPKKGQSSAETATVLSKITKHILEQNGYKRREKQVWKNGLIKRRGYFDVRMEFDAGNVNGEVVIRDRDPLTVIPDPFAESYDPKEWADVTLISWLSLDEIQGRYGKEARDRVEKVHGQYEDNPFSEEFGGRNKLDDRQGFANGKNFVRDHQEDNGERRYRIIERQFYQYDFTLHYVDPRTGDMEMVRTGTSPAEAAAYAQQNGYLVQKMNVKRVRWRICTRLCVLYDDWSPYLTFSIVPFFYLFDYGDTIGMVDNAISPQDLHNKSLSAYLHILTSTSNSGWKVPKRGDKSGLTNMNLRELSEKGMKTGIVVEYDIEIGAPEKIAPNQVPNGVDRLIDRGETGVKRATGMGDVEQGLDSPEVSGIALHAKQFQSKLQLADPLDNLESTRIMIGRKVLELVQEFYTSERVFKIAGKDPMTGKPTEDAVTINQVDERGNIFNDITVGEYEVEVTTTPMAATHENGQFQQAFALRTEAGVAIPDDEMVRMSNLDGKHELAQRLANPADDGVAAVQKQKLMADIALLEARRIKELASATNTNVQAMFGATNAGQMIAGTPQISPLADEILLSAGFQDANAAPLVPELAAPALPPATIRQNTSPNFPPQADSGVTSGIEGGL